MSDKDWKTREQVCRDGGAETVPIHVSLATATLLKARMDQANRSRDLCGLPRYTLDTFAEFMLKLALVPVVVGNASGTGKTRGDKG